MLIAACKCSYSAPRDCYALVTPSLEGDAALAATACSLEHVRRLQRSTWQLCARHAISRWQCCVGSNSTLVTACKCGQSAPRDSYTLVTPSFDGNAAFSPTARSLQHASAATVRRVTAMRSSRHLSMAVLRCQQQPAHWGMQVRLQRGT